jgi:hypothetical protein
VDNFWPKNPIQPFWFLTIYNLSTIGGYLFLEFLLFHPCPIIPTHG